MHVAVIGGGILGLATARALGRRGHRVTVLEKEDALAQHQTGHNSGVAHAGLYYPPGSLKARMAVAGNRSIVEYAQQHDVPAHVCGKLVVATEHEELPALHALGERATANGVPARTIGVEQAREYEPEVRCVAALRVDSTALVDFPGVCRALAGELQERGGNLRTGTPVLGIRARSDDVQLATPDGVVTADALVNCAGLHADRVAELAGVRTRARIVAFRGEYYELTSAAAPRVRGLIYPVPDPALPFLGVHLTRMLDGKVHAGPNAVLALRREGYRWRDVSARDVAGVLAHPGFWRLAARHYRQGAAETVRSLSRRRFAGSLARLVPDIGPEDLAPASAGVRAQALGEDGSLVGDFLLQGAQRQVHVLNAPSPAATCALEIGEHVAREWFE